MSRTDGRTYSTRPELLGCFTDRPRHGTGQQAEFVGFAFLAAPSGLGRDVAALALAAPGARIRQTECLGATGGRIAAHVLVVDAIVAEVLVVARRRDESRDVAFFHARAVSAVGRLDDPDAGPFLLGRAGGAPQQQAGRQDNRCDKSSSGT